MIEEWEDNQMSLMDRLDDIWGCLDYFDVLETIIRTAVAPVSRNASHGRFDMELVAFPRGDKFDVKSTAGEAVRLMRAAGVVCGCIGFNSRYTFWMVRKSQITWAKYLMGGEAGERLRTPKRLWEHPNGKTFLQRIKTFLQQIMGG